MGRGGNSDRSPRRVPSLPFVAVPTAFGGTTRLTPWRLLGWPRPSRWVHDDDATPLPPPRGHRGRKRPSLPLAAGVLPLPLAAGVLPLPLLPGSTTEGGQEDRHAPSTAPSALPLPPPNPPTMPPPPPLARKDPPKR